MRSPLIAVLLWSCCPTSYCFEWLLFRYVSSGSNLFSTATTSKLFFLPNYQREALLLGVLPLSGKHNDDAQLLLGYSLEWKQSLWWVDSFFFYAFKLARQCHNDCSTFSVLLLFRWKNAKIRIQEEAKKELDLPCPVENFFDRRC